MKALTAGLLLAFSSSLAFGAVTRARYLMGTLCEITADDPTEIDAALDEAARVESMLSTWRTDTELARVNSGKQTRVSPELMQLIDDALKYRDYTNGAFDPLVGPLVDIWQTRGRGAIPSSEAIADALRRVHAANPLANGGRFEEGAFGKGYAIDRMLRKMKGDVVINFGGQLAVRGRSTVAIADPDDRRRPMIEIEIKNASLSTSSGSEQFFTIDGRRFTHIIDPRTGQALPPRGSVSVVHQSAFLADIFSTALYVMGPEDGFRWAREHDINAIFITESHQVLKTQDDKDLAREVEELKREIDVLSREIESLKGGRERKAEEPAAPSYGLGTSASKVYRAEPGVSFGGYGEFLYTNPQHEAASADLVRAVLYTGYKFNRRMLFNSELEVEHASTEHAGAVSVEFAYLDYLLRPSANVRAGLVLLPMGLINEQHEPTAYFGTHRPEVEDRILPTTWSELGAGVFGDAGSLSYRTYVVTGLDSSRFSADEGLHEGKQGGSEAAAEDLAITGRIDWHPVEGVLLGASAYTGDSGQGAGFNGRVSLFDLHGDAKFRGVSLRGVAARGRVGDAAAISEQTGQTIGSSLGGWYVEGAYDLSALLRRSTMSISPYVRYERLDTQRRVPLGLERDRENDRRITALGVAFKPIPQTVIKTDWEKIRTGAGTSDRRFNVGVGYIF